jgi:hypothetical protein
MTDRRRHRGPHPDDARLFAPSSLPTLRSAVDDLCWLLDRGYALPSALKLVGDRYQLEERQRLAVFRSACSTGQKRRRERHRCPDGDLHGARVLVDGYNILTTVEAALSGGVLILGRDGCLRDLASMHGTYRKVEETLPALQLVDQGLTRLGVAAAHWLLDCPVSNSGRLKQIMEQEYGRNWTVELAQNPDGLLARSEQIVCSADSAVLDRCARWFNLVPSLLAPRWHELWIIDMSAP